jgi:hypothetical protein
LFVNTLIFGLLACLPVQDDPATIATKLDQHVRAMAGYAIRREAKPVSDEIFLRRLTKDLVDAVPTPQEIEAFVQDSDPGKRSKAVERLVGDGRFDAFWARRFTKVLFPDHERGPWRGPQALPSGTEARAVQSFERWFEARIKADRPWTETVSLLLESRGDLRDHPEAAYLLSFHRGQGAGTEFASGAARQLLGVRLYCARCHDHPYDKWTVQDYYGFGAFLARQRMTVIDGSVRLDVADSGELESPDLGGGKEAAVNLSRGGKVLPRFLFGGAPGPSDDRMKALARRLTAPGDTVLARAAANRIWSWLFGRGIVHPADDFSLTNKPLSRGLLEGVVGELTAHQHSLKRLVRVLCATEAYQMPTPEELAEAESFRHYARRHFADAPPVAPAPKLSVLLDLPPGWFQSKARSGARAAFGFPASDEAGVAAEVLLYEGTADAAYLQKLQRQFQDGKPRVMEQEVVGALKVTLTEIAGIHFCHRSSDGPMEALHWVAAFRLQSGKPHYLVARGPATLLKEQREEFISLLKSLKE